MLKLDTLLDLATINNVRMYTKQRFSLSYNLTHPEALTLWEQQYLEEPVIRKLCEEDYGVPLERQVVGYVPDDIVRTFEGTGFVPCAFMCMENVLYVLTLSELKTTMPSIDGYKVEVCNATIYDYLNVYTRRYGTHPMLLDVSAKLLVDIIVKEAIDLGAADITISTVGRSCSVYYNVRKNKVRSHRVFGAEYMLDVISYLTIKNPIDFNSNKPKYVDVDLNKSYRGRVVISRKFKGYTITIRLLPNAAFNKDIKQLNLTEATSDWLVSNIINREKGLRLIVGETMSGKNTTALALLNRIAELDRYKIVSVELNVEQELEGIEQINCLTDDEFYENIVTLIHQNPDFVYITEIRDKIAKPVMQVTNTGKCVLSSLHANSVADTISRLVDISGMTPDRVVQTLHSIVYQELVRDDEHDVVYPRCRYVKFDEELKYELYGKSLGDMYKILKDREEGDEWNSVMLTKS